MNESKWLCIGRNLLILVNLYFANGWLIFPLQNKLFVHTRCVWKVTGTVQCASCTKKGLSHRKKHCFLSCHDVLRFRKPNFNILWQLHSFLHVFLSRHFFVIVFWKFDKIKNFWLFSLVRRTSVEQRINLKFLVRLRKTPTEALKLLQEVYGDDTISRTRLFEWHRRFKEGRQ